MHLVILLGAVVFHTARIVDLHQIAGRHIQTGKHGIQALNIDVDTAFNLDVAFGFGIDFRDLTVVIFHDGVVCNDSDRQIAAALSLIALQIQNLRNQFSKNRIASIILIGQFDAALICTVCHDDGRRALGCRIALLIKILKIRKRTGQRIGNRITAGRITICIFFTDLVNVGAARRYSVSLDHHFIFRNRRLRFFGLCAFIASRSKRHRSSSSGQRNRVRSNRSQDRTASLHLRQRIKRRGNQISTLN